MKSSSVIRTAVRQALCVGALATASSYAPVAFAQDSDDATLEEITVTGSRIQRQDFECVSPIVSLSADAFSNGGIYNAEELVNTLPQVVPSFSAGNNNPGNGQSWINLRGMGSARNLVLVDGKRPTPANEDGIVDINTFDFQDGTDYSETIRASINLFYNPTEHVTMGVEYLWGQRQNKDKTKGSATQLQFSARYTF